MAFADEVAKRGRGVAYRLDVSTDFFATVAHRWSSRFFLDGSGNAYEPRLLMRGNVARMLGTGNGGFPAGSMELTLRNEDGGVDWVVNQATAEQLMRARARLYVGLYDLEVAREGGLLRTNLLPRSQELNAAPWSGNGATLSANAATAPDGTATADRLIEDTGVGTNHDVRQSLALADGSIVRLSVYAKPTGLGSARRARLQMMKKDGASFPSAVFDVSAGTIIDDSGSLGARIEDAGGGWYRISATFDVGSGASTPLVMLLLMDGSNIFYTGDGVSGLYLWGAQVEAGSRTTKYIATAAAAASDVAVEWKQLGEFTFAEGPRRNAREVSVTLVDASAGGFLDAPVVTPTLDDWFAADSSSTTNPLRATYYRGGNYESPDPFTDPLRGSAMPLAWGDGRVRCSRLTRPAIRGPGTLDFLIPFLVCCTTATDAVTSNDVTEVWIDGFAPDALKTLPTTEIEKFTNASVGTERSMYEVFKSATITKDGRSFKALWLGIDARPFAAWASKQVGETVAGGVDGAIEYAKEFLFERNVWVKGFPLSARTFVSSGFQSPSYVATDLLTYYTKAGAAYLDTASVNRVLANYPAFECFGVINEPGDSRPLGEHLADLAASFDLDFFLTWDGKLGMSARNRDFTALTESRRSVDETLLSNVEDWIPGPDERGAPFNRIVLVEPRHDPQIGDRLGGPFDDPLNTQADSAWGRVVQKSLPVRWVPPKHYGISPFRHRSLDTVLRPRIRFTMPMEGLLLELGNYFELAWTRNMGGPYAAGTVFQVEALTFNCDALQVTVEAMWAGDLTTDRPYILDDETLHVKATGSGSRTATVVDGSATVNFSSGNLVSDGVADGDLLILRDATEAQDQQKRNKVVYITAVAATQLTVSDPLDSLDFDAPGAGVAVQNWEIRRSHVTFPTPSSDVANYPTQTAANAYGRVANQASSGVYSANGTGAFTDAHKLLDG